MLTPDELLASLQVSDCESYLPDSDNEGRYFDWSSVRPDGSVGMEIGNGAEAVVVDLMPAEIADLHQRLTVWLLLHC